MDKVKFCSLSVRGLGDFKKRKSIFNFLHVAKADIILLQETHVSDKKTIKVWNQEWGSETYHSTGSASSGGVAILFNKRIPHKVDKCISDDSGRLLSIKIKLFDNVFTITNVYAPNMDDPEFFIYMINQHESLMENDIDIIGGNFNMVFKPEMDRHQSMVNHNKSITVLEEFMERKDQCDTWRVFHPASKRYTWHRPANKSASRIDFFLTPQSILDLTTDCNIVPAVCTDHSLVELSIEFSKTTRGPGFWKLNNTLLFEENYVNLMIDTITGTSKACPLANPEEEWIMIKENCAKISKEYSKNKAAKNRNELDQL